MRPNHDLIRVRLLGHVLQLSGAEEKREGKQDMDYKHSTQGQSEHVMQPASYQLSRVSHHQMRLNVDVFQLVVGHKASKPSLQPSFVRFSL